MSSSVWKPADSDIEVRYPLLFATTGLRDSGSAQNHLIVGKLPCELWASENRGLRTSISMGFLGMFRTGGFWANSSSYQAEQGW